VADAADVERGFILKYVISIPESKAYVRVTARGPIAFEHDDPTRLDNVKDALAANINRFLIDLTHAKNESDAMAQHQFAYNDLQEAGVDLNSKIALLVRDDDRTHDFIETVLLNAGYACLKFSDEDTAIGWLEE
jgi:hypothetical protein